MPKIIQKQSSPVQGELPGSKTSAVSDVKKDNKNSFYQKMPIGIIAQPDPEASKSNPGASEAASNNTKGRLKHDFNRVLVHSGKSAKLQAKLTSNKPGDMYEQEADQVANQVMHMPESHQKQACTCGGSCSKCQASHVDHNYGIYNLSISDPTIRGRMLYRIPSIKY